MMDSSAFSVILYWVLLNILPQLCGKKLLLRLAITRPSKTENDLRRYTTRRMRSVTVVCTLSYLSGRRPKPAPFLYWWLSNVSVSLLWMKVVQANSWDTFLSLHLSSAREARKVSFDKKLPAPKAHLVICVWDIWGTIPIVKFRGNLTPNTHADAVPYLPSGPYSLCSAIGEGFI